MGKSPSQLLAAARAFGNHNSEEEPYPQFIQIDSNICFCTCFADCKMPYILSIASLGANKI